MTPKEKAEELVNKFIKPTIKWNPVNGIGYYNDLNAAKECAFVAVDELIDEASQKIHTQGRCMLSDKEYWQEVKQEIEVL